MTAQLPGLPGVLPATAKAVNYLPEKLHVSMSDCGIILGVGILRLKSSGQIKIAPNFQIFTDQELPCLEITQHSWSFIIIC